MIKSTKKAPIFAKWILIYLALIGFAAPLLSNDKPLVASVNKDLIFPTYTQFMVDMGWGQWDKDLLNIDWKVLPYDWALWPLIPYAPKSIDYFNANAVSPFVKQEVSSLKWQHWLGTDMLGRDVLATMIHGTRTALLTALFATIIAGLIGVLLGSLAGYMGDNQLKISSISLILLLLGFFISWFYGVYVNRFSLTSSIGESLLVFVLQFIKSLIIITFILSLILLLIRKIDKRVTNKKKLNIAVDLIISRGIEIFESIPTLFLILSLIAIAKPSLGLVIIIIGFTAWPSIARFTRAEILRVKQTDYIESAKALGIKPFGILSKHILPNVWQPIIITLAFTAAGAILAESTLSFLGIGLAANDTTWGSLLSEARQAPKAWWLAVFPGLAIFITVYSLNIIGERK